MPEDRFAAKALIALITKSAHAKEVLKQSLNSIRDLVGLTRVSAIYRFNSSAGEDVEKAESLSLCIEVTTDLSPEKLMRKIEMLEKGLRQRFSHSEILLYLLLLPGHMLLSPGITLPYPNLHSDPKLLVPAAELWGQYRHPVLGRKLAEISRELSTRDWGEFYGQGKSLLDF